MDPYAISLADVFRILEALDQTGGDRLIQGLKNRTLIRNIEHGRVTLGMILQLLDQTDGCTTLPDDVVEILRRARLGSAIDVTLAGTQAPAQLATASSTWLDALTFLPPGRRISIDEVERHLSVRFSPEQRVALERIPFAKETLNKCNITHVLFPGFPITIEQLARIAPVNIFSNAARVVAMQSQWGQQQPACRWYLLRCGVTPRTTSRTYNSQLTQLSDYEEVPQLAEMVFGMVLNAMVRDYRLFQRQHVRCAPVPPGNVDQPIVGCFTKHGFEMRGFGPTRANDILGLAAMRRLNT